MHIANHWGGTLEIVGESQGESPAEDIHRSPNTDWDKSSASQSQKSSTLDETQRSWLLGPDSSKNKKNKYVDFGFVVCSRRALRWTVGMVVVAFLVVGMPIIVSKSLPEHHQRSAGVDDYAVAVGRALLFFNAQKSGRLPKNNGVPWRGNSGLEDGNTTDVKGGLVGGYYDAGDNVKFHFPMSFAMTMLSWSVIEYESKYKKIGEYNHVRELIKWGTDYLLLTFNSSASKIDKVYSQVGGSQNGSTIPDDHTCWTRPEDMHYPRPVQTSYSAPDLAAEMAAALAAASIVFRDNNPYSEHLAKGAATVFDLAMHKNNRFPYSLWNPYINPYYNSSGYYDEYMWGATWLYYATGNSTYISLATNSELPDNAKAFSMIPDLSVLSWDNKLPAAMLLLTRLRIFLSPGYPYEEMLRSYHNVTGLTMCSYLQRYHVFNWTRGGLIQLNPGHGHGQLLQYVANAAFLASLFSDYLKASGVPGWDCGPDFIFADDLHNFATSQINYILGKNPINMSYLVGYGNNYPKYVHHRGASIPHDNKKYSCKDGWKWFKSRNPNPNTVTGAMVGGPDQFDKFKDERSSYSYTEPTLAGNAGLVAALVSVSTSGTHNGIDKNIIFSAVPPLYPVSPPPPPPWKP